MKTKIKDEKSLELLNNYISELHNEISKGKSERLIEYLNFASSFYKYSFYNTLLIHFQCPGASFVSGFKTWNELGYKIKKGSKAIRILAPRFYRFYLDQDNNRIYLKKDMEAPEDVKIFEDKYFIGVNVFDISQTEKTSNAKTIDTIFYNLGNDCKDKYQKLVKIFSKSFKITEASTGLKQGYATAGGEIVINKDNDYNNKLLTLIHEIAHQILHFNNNKPVFDFTREDKEVQAEAVSYVVGKYLGLNNPFASDYIIAWGRDKQALKNNLKYVIESSREIINTINKGNIK